MSNWIFWIILISLTSPPVYEIDNFYYYDQNSKQKALSFQSKVFIPENINNFDISAFHKRKFEKIKNPHNKGWIVYANDNADGIVLMNQLAESKIFYHPVVNWDNQNCIPTNTIIIKTKTFVTEKLLLKRLKFGKIPVSSLVFSDGVWFLEVGMPIVTPNILALANMISEDTLWIEWARVNFVPIFQPIIGAMKITQPNLNLGYDRELDIVISIYKSSVKIRKDLLPKLGFNKFFPYPLKDSVWYDIGPTKITEEKILGKTVISMKTKFRYLNHGSLQIPGITVAYEDGSEKGILSIPGVGFYSNSIIEDAGIDDIQPIPSMPLMSKLSVPDTEHKFLYWQLVGFLIFSVGFVVLFVLNLNEIPAKIPQENHTDIFKELSFFDNIKPDEWRSEYKKISEKLSKILAVCHNITIPISSDSVEEPNLRIILGELEKLYQENAEPDLDKMSIAIKKFIIHY